MQLPIQSLKVVVGAAGFLRALSEEKSDLNSSTFIPNLPDFASIDRQKPAPKSYSAYLSDQHLTSQFISPSSEAGRLSLISVSVL